MLQIPLCATGQIKPAAPLAGSFAHQLSAGKWQIAAPGNSLVCMDGRESVEGPRIGIAVPGGAAFVAVLTWHLLVRAGKDLTVPQVVPAVVRSAAAAGFPLAVHTGPSETGSGCGAMDALAAVYELVENSFAHLSAFNQQLGLPCLSHLAHLQFPSGRQLLRAFTDADVSCYQLVGEHREQAVIYNFKPGSALDKVSLAKHQGIEFFEVDAWAFEAAAQVAVRAAKYLGVAEAALYEQAFAAAATFAAGACCVLCGPQMPVLQVGRANAD